MLKDDPFLLWLMSLNLTNFQMNKLLKNFGNARKIFALGGRIDQIGEFATKIRLDAAVRAAEGFNFISRNNAYFPKKFKNMADAPIGIFAKGNMEIWKNLDEIPTVGIVGMRDNTIYGRDVTRKLAKELAISGITIVSGMARGLDAHAHAATLAAGGDTIGVLPCGIDICYPLENKKLYEQISKQGLLISEYFPGTRAEKWTFIARNRIVSALSDVLVVTEAAERSGTLSTVEHALSQGKDVMAVPGSILSPQSRGTNGLIREGAGVATSHADVLIALKNQKHLKEFFKGKNLEFKGFAADTSLGCEKISLASDESLVYSCINYENVSIDYIMYKTNLPISKINKILLDMELDGKIRKLPGNVYAKI